MIDFEKEFARPGYELGRRQVKIAATFRLVYGWMCAGLALSGLVAWYTATSGLYQRILSGPVFYGCLFGELILVFVLSGNQPTATPCCLCDVCRLCRVKWADALRYLSSL